jgi:ABC-type phosphate/phosphonate transport system substrate-binding protein
LTGYRVGAVAYHPRVVVIWEGFRSWLRKRGLPLDYRLFSTYEAQVDALVAGEIEVAWNTNLAYVRTRERAGRACRALAMRDTDRDWTSVAVVPAGAERGIEGLRGKRVGFGDSDSSQAWILPAFALRRQGLDPDRDLVAECLDRDLGKHGDTGGAELVQLGRLRAGQLDASICSAPTLEELRATGSADDLAVAWTSPPFHHCNFTTLGRSPENDERFRALLFEMHPDDEQIRESMRLEWVNRWVDGDESGYADLIEAVRSFPREETAGDPGLGGTPAVGAGVPRGAS